MTVVTLARHAMATRFELVLHGRDPVRLRAAGEEALDEIERLEAQLSLFRSSSEIAHLNARAAHEPVRVTPSLFGLLQHAQKLSAETRGAFDITIAPLVRCWGFMGGPGQVPSPEDLEEARAKVGMHLVNLDRKELTVRFRRTGVMLDLGAIGKGYAIDRAVERLREAGIEDALLHGGTSTVYALGQAPEGNGWQIAIADPRNSKSPCPVSQFADSASFALVTLRDESLSVSAIWGKFFKVEGRTMGHIIDPRTGQPAATALLSAVVLPSATETDALSTALLTLGPEGYEQVVALRTGMRALVVSECAGELVSRGSGISV